MGYNCSCLRIKPKETEILMSDTNCIRSFSTRYILIFYLYFIYINHTYSLFFSTK